MLITGPASGTNIIINIYRQKLSCRTRTILLYQRISRICFNTCRKLSEHQGKTICQCPVSGICW